MGLRAASSLASPILIYEFWAFVGPAFSPVEPPHGRCSWPHLRRCSSSVGVALGYFIVLPKGPAWLFGFNDQYFNTQARATDYFSFVAWFLVAFGAVFEMPVVIIAAMRMGIVETKFLRKHWRYAIVINAIIAMVATPSQDAFSFIAMFIPLEILYEAVAARRAGHRAAPDGRSGRRPPTTTRGRRPLPPEAATALPAAARPRSPGTPAPARPGERRARRRLPQQVQ